jgi:diguanylate cyclase (GGDEF)-like protein/PAS domain S-box-containing protein
VHRYQILDTAPESAFDGITRLAARIFDVPLAAVSIVDLDRIWFKSVFGLVGAQQIRRSVSRCFSLIEGDEPYIVEDGLDDPRLQMKHRNARPMDFRFYVGMPLVTNEGYTIGALSVCDHIPHAVTPDKVAMLADLAKMVMDELELRLVARRLDAVSSLRIDEEHFRLLVDGVKDYAIFMLDPDGRVASWNPGAERFKGYKAKEIIGRHYSLFYPAEDIAAGKPTRLLATALADGRVEDVGWRVRQDGTWFWASVVITPLRDPDGTLRGYGKITRDLTESRLIELALRVTEERFRCSFDQAQIGMQIIGLDGRYERVNDAFCSIVGYRHDQIAGLSESSLTHPDDVEAGELEMCLLLAGSATPRERELRYLHVSGQAVWAAVYTTLIRDPEGKPLHFIAQVQDVTERRKHDRQLEHMADHDPLTGLLNRRSFMRELDGHVGRVARYGVTGAVLMIDLDNFKHFNDSQGHSAGDQLIVRIAHGLQSRLRGSDVLARLGGDEFAVLLPNADAQAPQIAAEALLQVVRDQADPLMRLRRVTASIGIAHFADGEHLSSQEIVVNADLAMYDAKEAGRDRCARYCTLEQNRPKIEGRLKWAKRISDAVAHGSFELLAQPIVPLHGNGTPHYELLLRMRDESGGLVPAASFLQVAERIGLIGQIDHWVTRRAIDMLAEQRAAGRDLRFSINLSGISAGDEALVELIEERLLETGVPPDRLIFEVTETAAVAHMARVVQFSERLAELGCAFALDDFGGGFGSFYYLKHLPFDYLKIDGEFVEHCVENETDRILIAAVVQIAHGMGKQTIAEFVRNQEIADVLTSLGVDYSQGFHHGRPAPLDEHLSLPAVSVRHSQLNGATALFGPILTPS